MNNLIKENDLQSKGYMSVKELKANNMLKTNILLVEDTPLIQHIHKTILSSINCDVTIAKNGCEALSLIRFKKYDLIFMDINLPDINGLEITEQIRQNKNFNQHTPIVALTTVSKETLQNTTQAKLLDDYLPKPMVIDDAKKILEKWI